MGDEAQFPIKITGDASSAVAAAKQTDEALGQTKLKLSELTPEQKAYAQSHDSVKKAADEAGKSEEQAGRHTEKLAMNHRELHHVLAALGPEAERAGFALREAMSGNKMMLGVAVILAAVGLAKKAIDDWNAKLDATAAANASRDFLPGIQAELQAMQDGAEQAAKFAAALNGVGSAEDKIKSAADAAVAALHALSNAKTEQSNADEALELAKVDLAEKLGPGAKGGLSEIQALEKRAAIRKKYTEQRAASQTTDEQKELEIRKQELAADEAQKAQLEAEEKAARKKAAALKGRVDARKENLEKGLEKSNPEGTGYYDKEVKEAQEAVDFQEGFYPPGTAPKPGSPAAQTLEAAQERLRVGLGMQRRQKLFNDRAKSQAEALAGNPLADAEEEAQIAAEKARQNRERINALNKEIPAKQETLGITEAGRAKTAATKEETEAVTAAAQIAAKLQAVQKELAELKSQIVRAAESGHPVNAAALNALTATVEKNRELAKALADQEQRIRAIEGRPPRVF
jgi:hypothetical protein